MLRPLALVLLAPLSAAQSFNLDVGDNLILWPTPPSSYGAAAAQAGEWNAVITPYDQVLNGLDGATTGVTVRSDVTQSFNWPFGSLPSNDSALMDDIQNIDPLTGQATWTFEGLANGSYDVFTYTWNPEDQPGAVSSVEVVGSTGAEPVGGTWAGSPHAEGTTHSVQRVGVTDGTLTVIVSATAGLAVGVNGFQLVQLEGEVGVNYCAVNPNSTGGPAIMSGSGSASIAVNDLTLTASGVPTQPFLFFHAPNQIELPFGNGFLCAGGGIVRLNPPSVASSGTATRSVDLPTEIGAPGTRNFQCWFRDPLGGGASYNTSDGYSITFVP